MEFAKCDCFICQTWMALYNQTGQKSSVSAATFDGLQQYQYNAEVSKDFAFDTATEAINQNGTDKVGQKRA